MYYLVLNSVAKNIPYWDRQACANSVDPDQTPQNAASDLGLHCLPLIQQYFRNIIVEWILLDLRASMINSYGVPILKVNTVSTRIMTQ